MSIEAGRAYFRQFGMEDRVQEFTVSSATVDLAAKALGVEGARIAKTLSFKTADGCMLILAAGDARIDNHKFKEKFHMKAKMLSADEVLELVGHPVGGVCPFGCKEGIPVYLDVSLQRFETVFPAVGSAASAIELNISYDGISATLKDVENHNNSKDSHNGHFTDPNLHFNEQRLTRLRAGTNYEFSGQSRTCYPLLELTGLFGHLPQS